MNQGVFNYNSKRAQLARINHILTPTLVAFMIIGGTLLITGGVLLVALHEAVGWFLVGLGSMMWMVSAWSSLGLRKIGIDNSLGGIDGLCDVRVLGSIHKNAGIKDITAIACKTSEGRFLAKRFGITSDFVMHLVADDTDDFSLFMQVASEVMASTGSSNISPGVIIVSAIKMNPQHESILASMRLDVDILQKGIIWYKKIQDALENYSTRFVKTGGLARDWSFGWTPVLNKLGHNASLGSGSGDLNIAKDVHADILHQLIQIMSQPGNRSVVLVGKNGVGKTELLNSFGGILMDGSSNLPESLLYHQLVMLDATSLISAGTNRGEIESLVSHVVSEAINSKNIILGLDNAHLFFKDGIGSINISNLLRPLLESSSIPIILVFDDSEFAKLVAESNQFANMMQRINVPEVSKDDAFLIMQNQVVLTEYQKHIVYTYQALIEAYELGLRYVKETQMPAQALILLEAASNFHEGGMVSALSVRKATESMFGVKLGVGDDKAEKEKLLNLETLIHDRMINQVHAVQVVSDALRRSQSGVRNPNRPIGTFLFLGPTGVGKTELAKSLADVYFGGEDKMVRIDMNGYAGEADTTRLLEDASKNSMSLGAQISKNPFSVVLLDEIEKAHPKVLSILLQMLDEGVLRDENNKEISFRDSIVIATSNAGAEFIREHIARGMDITKLDKELIDTLLKTNIFTPEFVNRFDEVVMFTPLVKEDLKQVVGIIIKNINKTLEQQKIQIILDSDAIEYLVDQGNDPIFGARPMRRIVQKAVENLIAKEMLSGNASPGQMLSISKDQIAKFLDNKKDS